MFKENSQPSAVYRDPNLHILFGVTLMVVMGVSSITPAFPKIAGALNISSSRIGLLITVYSLPGIIMTPLLGVLADIYGRKRILGPSLLLFGIAGFLCGFTENFNILLIMRFFQGLGAAAIGSLNLTIIGDLFSGEKRASAMGYNASVLSIGTTIYPAIGGFLATLGWNYPFFLPILAIPVGFTVLYLLKNPEPRQNHTLGLYLRNALRSVQRTDVIVLFSSTTVTFIILYGSYLTYLPVFMGIRFTPEPWKIGIIMSSMSLTTALISSRLGNLSAKYSVKSILIFSYFLYATALVIIPLSGSIRVLVVAVILFGLGHGINVPSIQTLLAGMAPMEYRGAFMSFNGMVLSAGQSLGPLIMGIVFGWLDIQGVFFAGALLSLITSLCLPWFIKKPD